MYVIEVPFLDLDQIYKSGQALRWIKLRDGKYVVQDGRSAVKVEQQKNRLIMSCTEEEFYNKWYNYFDLGTDYGDAYFKLCRKGGFPKKCAVRSGGVRVIKQDLFECIVTNVVFSTIDFEHQAMSTLNKVLLGCGIEHIQGMREAARVRWYEFPTPLAILEKIDSLSLPEKTYWALKEVCEGIYDGWLCLEELNIENARDCLLEFDIDNKAIDYILLYGLHDLSCLPQCKFEDNVKALNLKGQEGVVYSYVMNHKLNPPKNLADEMKVGAHKWG